MRTYLKELRKSTKYYSRFPNTRIRICWSVEVDEIEYCSFQRVILFTFEYYLCQSQTNLLKQNFYLCTLSLSLMNRKISMRLSKKPIMIYFPFVELLYRTNELCAWNKTKCWSNARGNIYIPSLKAAL